MNQQQYNQLFSFIWNIATDVLVYAFEKGEYKKIIMPMMVLRRIDVLLEPTKEKLLEMKKMLDDNHFNNQDPILFSTTSYPFYNTSLFTMKTLKSETDPLRLKMNFTDYLNGFSKDVQDIIDKFHMRQMVDNLTEAERLGSIIEKFTDDKINLSNKPVLDDEGNVRLPGLDNHTMGTMFEELLRKFNEENNVTEAGEHFTPRDYVKLLADLAVLPIADKITDTTYSIYDGACGTGGILTIAQERILEIAKEHDKKVQVDIYGQELTPETYATCKADLMISGNIESFQYLMGTQPREYIAFDSTISRDGHAGETFDFCISNPPFGTPWKEDLKKRGLGEKDKKKFTDSRFEIIDSKGNPLSFIPDIGDCQMMFLANNLSRMREDTALGTRIVEVHNGSSLFTGDAGSGASNLRQYIIENDLLEAIIAMPEKDFYNTGIGTFIWVITNRKEERRRGFVQLIDATEIKSPLRKNLGEKNCETTDEDRKKIIKLLTDFAETPQSKIFPNNEFGYWSVKVDRPLRQSITLNRASLQRAVYALSRRDVELNQECRNALIYHGVIVPLKDETPVLVSGTSIFDKQYEKFRSIKIPKTVGQLLADEALSITLLILCKMMDEKQEWLDMAEFESRFDNETTAKAMKLKYSKIESILPIFRHTNPKAEIVLKGGKPIPDASLRDTEIIPFRYEGGIDGFLKNEILPYNPDAWIDPMSIQTGYELSFTKYFYKPNKLRLLSEISNDICTIEERTDGLLDEILKLKNEIFVSVTKDLNPDVKMKESKTPFFGLIPEHWEERKMKYCFSERSEKNHPDEPVLCSSQSQGVIPQSMYKNRVVVVNKGFEGLKFVKKGDFVISLRSFEGGIEYAYYQGIISAAYTILTPIDEDYSYYYKMLFKSAPFIQLLQTCVTGIREGQNINYQLLSRKHIPVPPKSELNGIISKINEKCEKINSLISELEAEIEYLKEYKQSLIADCVTGQINVQNKL